MELVRNKNVAINLLKAGQPVTKNWVPINQLLVQQRRDAADLTKIFADVGDLKKGRVAHGFGHFPFRLYKLPDCLRTTPDPSTDWLKLSVRAGIIFINWVQITPSGTDGAAFPFEDSYPLTSGAGTNEVSVTSGVSQYWFWLTLTSTTAVVNHGATAPTWTSANIPIGYVDTTDTTNKYARINQIIETNIFTCV